MSAGDEALNLVLNITAVDAASSVLNGLAGALKSLPGPLQALAGAAVTAGVALATAAEKAGTFQQSMNMLVTSAGESATAVKSSSGQIVGGIQLVSDGLKQMAVDTGTSTQQLASGMYYVESSGQHGAAGLQVMKAAAEGAKAENADLATVTKALTTVMTDYQLPVEDSNAAMNGLIATVQNGKTSLQDLSASMGQVLPIASALHISFPQVAGMMDTMTNAGKSSEDAANNLAHVLVALQAPSGVAVGAMKDVGLSAQQVKDTLVSQGLPQAFQLIEDHVGKKFPADSYQGEQALKNILGGLVGLKTAAMITGDSLAKTEQNIKKVASAYDDAGAAVRGWDTVQTGFNFQMDRAQQAINVLFITIGQKLLPILTPIVSGFANAVSSLTAFVSGMDDANNKTSALGTALQTAGKIFSTLWDIISKVADVVANVFNTGWQLASGIVGDFASGALADLVSGFQEFLTWLDQVVTNVDAFAKTLQDNVQPIVQVIKPLFDELVNDAGTWGNNMMVAFGNGIIAAGEQVISAVEQIAQSIADYLGFASPTKKGPGSRLNNWGVGLLSGLSTSMLSAMPYILEAVSTVASSIQDSATPGGILHSAITSVLDPLTGDSLKVTTNPATTKPATGLPTQVSPAPKPQSPSSGLNSVAQAVHSSGSSIVAAVKATTSCSTPASTCASQASAAAKAQKAASSAAASKQRSSLAATAAAQKAKTSAAAAKQRAEHTAAMQKAHQHAAEQRTQAAAQRKATAEARAKQHAEAQAKREEIRKELAAQRAAEKAAKAAAKAGPTPVAGAAPHMDVPSGGGGGAATAQKQVQDLAKNASMASKNIENSFSGLAAFIQKIASQIEKAIQHVKGSFDSIGQTVSTQLMPALTSFYNSAIKPLIDGFGQLAGNIGKGLGDFGKWAASTKIVQQAWDELVGIFRIVISIVSSVIKALGDDLKAPMTQLSVTINTQLWPAFSMLIKSMAPLAPVVQALGKVLGGVLLVLLGLLLGLLNGVIRAFAGLLTGAIQAFGGLVQIIGGALTTINGFIQAFVGFIDYLFTGNTEEMQKGAQTMWDGIVEIWTGAGNVIMGIVRGLWRTLTGFFGGIYDMVVGYFTNLYDALIGHSIIPDIINGIIFWFKSLVDWFPGMITQFIQNITNWWTKVQTTAITAAKLLWTELRVLFDRAWALYIQPAINTFISGWNKFWVSVKTLALTLARDVWAAVKTVFDGTWATQLLPALTKIGLDFSNWFTAETKLFGTWALNLMIAFGKAITDNIARYITPAVTAVATAIKNVLGIASPAKTGPLSTSDQWMPNLMNMFATQIKQKEPGITAEVTNFANNIAQKFAALNTQVKTNTDGINTSLTTLATKIQQANQQATSQVTQLSANVQSQLTQLTQNMQNEQAKAAAWGAYVGGIMSTAVTNIDQAGQHIQGVAAMISAAVMGAMKGALEAGNSAADANKSTQKVVISVDQAATGAAKAAQDYNVAYVQAQNAMEAAGMSKTQAEAALLNAFGAYSHAFDAAIAAKESQSDAYASAQSAFNSSTQATISAAQEQQAQSAEQQAFQSAQQSMTAASMSQQQMDAANTAAEDAYASSYKSVLASSHSVQAAGQAAVAAFNSSIKASEASAAANKSQSSSSTSGKHAGYAVTYADISAGAAKTSASGDATAQTYASDASAKTGIISGLLSSAQGMIAGLKADVSMASSLQASISAMAASAAASVASMLAMHSPAKEGPLSDSDTWMPNMIKMFMSALNTEAPKLKNASSITAKGVKDAFNDAAQSIGVTITKLKQKGDDIYATIRSSTGGTGGTGGTPGIPAKYLTTTANVVGDIPVSYMVSPAVAGTSGTPGTGGTSQSMTIHLDLDGKTISKYVGKYINGEIHAQGAVRGL